MDEHCKRLRDLPGVDEVEGIYHVPSSFDYYNVRQTMETIDRVSISLFSLSCHDTDYDCFEWVDDDEADEGPPTPEQWETMLSNALKPYAETRPFWEALGWDITDGKGNDLRCAHYFAKQIIIAESGWVPDVRFTPDGSGAELPIEGPELTEEELAERLEQEVRDFFLNRKYP